MIMKASEAHNESQYNKVILDLENKIAEEIKKTTVKGEYKVSISIPTDTANYVREALREKLKELGYEYNIPPYEKRPAGCPTEQWRWYDNITISWL